MILNQNLESINNTVIIIKKKIIKILELLWLSDQKI